MSLEKESRVTLTSQDFHGTRALKAVSAGLEWDIMPMLLKQHHQREAVKVLEWAVLAAACKA